MVKKNFFNAELRFLTLKRENYKGYCLKQPLGTILLDVSKVLILTLVVSGVLLYCTIRFMSNCCFIVVVVQVFNV